MGAMSASDAAPLPRLGEVFFDVRGSSRSMRLSWYADTGVAVLSIWQGGMCTGTFRLAIDDLPRMVETLQRGPDGQRARPPAPARPGLGDVPADAAAGAPAMGPLPGGGLPDYDYAHTGYQAGPVSPAGPGRHSAPAGRYGEPTEYLPGTGQYEAEQSGTGLYEAEQSGTGPYEAEPPGPYEAGLPGAGPYLPAPAHGAGLPDQPVPPRPVPPARPLEPAGPAPFLTGPDSYQPGPPGRRAGYPAGMPAEYPPAVPNPGVPNHGVGNPGVGNPGVGNRGVPNHGVPNQGALSPGAAGPDRYPGDPYAGDPGTMDYQDAAQPAYYPPGTSVPARREAGSRSDTDYQAHYGGAVTDDIAPGRRRESSPYGRPPGNRGA